IGADDGLGHGNLLRTLEGRRRANDQIILTTGLTIGAITEYVSRRTRSSAKPQLVVRFAGAALRSSQRAITVNPWRCRGRDQRDAERPETHLDPLRQLGQLSFAVAESREKQAQNLMRLNISSLRGVGGVCYTEACPILPLLSNDSLMN